MELEERNLPCVEEILLLITISIVTPMSAWPADDGFTPLMTAPTLEHFMGDKRYWSFQNGVLASQGDGQLTESKRSEEHTSELQSPCNLVCRLLLEKKKRRLMIM